MPRVPTMPVRNTNTTPNTSTPNPPAAHRRKKSRIRKQNRLARMKAALVRTYRRAKAAVGRAYRRTKAAVSSVLEKTGVTRAAKAVWNAVKRTIDTVVVRPAKAVGRAFKKAWKWVASTYAFEVAHMAVRVMLMSFLVSGWVTLLVANPLITVVYSIAGWMAMEAAGHGMLWLKQKEETEGSRLAGAIRSIIHYTAQAVYVVMQLATAAVLASAFVMNPALLLVEIGLLAGVTWLHRRSTRAQVKWVPGRCKACDDKKQTLVNREGLCMECKRLQIIEDTRPPVQAAPVRSANRPANAPQSRRRPVRVVDVEVVDRVPAGAIHVPAVG